MLHGRALGLPFAGPGIYLLYCVASHRAYVGEAKSLRDRRRKHLRELAAGTHGNGHLQAAWRRYGRGAFVAVVLEALPVELDEAGRVDRENAWMARVDRAELYNLEVPAVASGFEPSAMRAALARPEVKARIAAGIRRAKARPEVKARASAASREVQARPEVRWAKARGEDNGRAVLDEAAIRSIVAACAPGPDGRRVRGVVTAQARLHGVTQPTVSKILAGKLWGHVAR